MVIFLPVNLSVGLYSARQLRNRIDLFQQDALAGTPIFILDERHGSFLNPSRENMTVARGLEMLRRAQIGQFRSLHGDPPFREVSIFQGSTDREQIGRKDEVAVALGNNSALTFELKESRFVYAIRLKYSYEDPEKGSALLQVFWKKSTKKDSVAAERNVHIQLQTGAELRWWLPYRAIIPQPNPKHVLEKSETIWVNDKINQFQICPDDKPRLFRVEGINLILPLED